MVSLPPSPPIVSLDSVMAPTLVETKSPQIVSLPVESSLVPLPPKSVSAEVWPYRVSLPLPP